MNQPASIRPVATKHDRKAFVDLAWDVYRDDPAWVPPLKDEVHGLITPGKNPWFEHARAQLWLAESMNWCWSIWERAPDNGGCLKRWTAKRPRR